VAAIEERVDLQAAERVNRERSAQASQEKSAVAKRTRPRWERTWCVTFFGSTVTVTSAVSAAEVLARSRERAYIAA